MFNGMKYILKILSSFIVIKQSEIFPSLYAQCANKETKKKNMLKSICEFFFFIFFSCFCTSLCWTHNLILILYFLSNVEQRRHSLIFNPLFSLYRTIINNFKQRNCHLEHTQGFSEHFGKTKKNERKFCLFNEKNDWH